jgi:lipopolysaccharide export system permease protein
MFLIGAPLGAIIKKGGLGFPVLVSIIFFIISYVINTSGVKLGRAGEISDFWAVWASNFMLLPFGLYFLKQAQNDSRLLEKDNYLVIIDKVKALFKKN